MEWQMIGRKWFELELLRVLYYLENIIWKVIDEMHMRSMEHITI